ncbi:hypothetical protein [Carnobacterium funditum]|uniref:hypothetical protein n=1 Tax=Carnobacterium funditum TaxID=2752 RepID=UPI000556D951|nr:hypothetical protein [Carnobacterium funditum]
MLIEVSDDFGNEMTRLAETANTTISEVIESGFKNSHFLKEDLLYGKDNFSDFIDEYLSVLSRLDRYQNELLVIIKEIDESEAIQHVFKELYRLANEDIWLLNKLFQVYKQPINLTNSL